jgi:hypothetical protein
MPSPNRSAAEVSTYVGSTLKICCHDQQKITWRESFRTYGPYATMLNDITFDSFHMFRADSQMLPGFTAAP